MTKLTKAIKQLEQEITQGRQAVYLQFAYTKSQLSNKLTSPPVFLLAFVTGGLAGRQVKRSFKKRRPLLQPESRTRVSFLQKIVTLSSEISLAVNLFNRIKNMLAR